MPLDCRVTLEADVQVYDVGTPDEAVRVAIATVGEELNPDPNYVEVDTATRTGPDGEALPPAFAVADEALVALELSLTVYNVESRRHAERVARKDVGGALADVPLTVESVTVVDEDTDAGTEDDAGDGEAGEEDPLLSFEDLLEARPRCDSLLSGPTRSRRRY